MFAPSEPLPESLPAPVEQKSVIARAVNDTVNDRDSIKSASSAPFTKPHAAHTGRTTLAATPKAVGSALPKIATMAPASNPKKINDADVDLLQALVTHVSIGELDSRKSGSSLGAPKTFSTASESDSATPKGNVRSTAAELRSEPLPVKNDVVIRTSGVTTRELVERCRSLGFLEGQLCRLRICAERWGSDPACPINASNH